MWFSPSFAVVGAFGSAPPPPFGGADASLPAPLGHKGCSYSTLALGTAGCLLLGDFVCTPIRGCSNVNLKGGNFSVQSVFVFHFLLGFIWEITEEVDAGFVFQRLDVYHIFAELIVLLIKYLVLVRKPVAESIVCILVGALV